MSAVIRPYADLSGIFAGLQYRGNPVDAFQPIDIDDDAASTIVRVDDLRTIPQHQIRLNLNLEALGRHYEKHKESIRLVVVARDTILRRELHLGAFLLDEIPTTIDLDRNLLRTTALRDVLPLNFAVVLDARLKGDSALPTQRASRLAELRFIIRNTATGAMFPFKRVTADQLRERNKPPETGVHLELRCDPEELITASDTSIANLLEVWVHEKVWTAIQNDRTPGASKMRLMAVTLTTTQLLLSAVIPVLKGGKEIDEGSVVGQLLSFVENQASLPEGRLRRQFQDDLSLHELDAYVQNAWRFVTCAGKVDEEAEEPL